MAEQEIRVSVRNMSKRQFRSLLSVLWLIAAGVQSDPWFELACVLFFVGYGIGALVALREEVRHG
jgi:hypothetical protein